MNIFTEAQWRAIRAEGNVLVSAGAGTGKTRTVVERCLRLIEEGCSLENMLMVTFTEAAAAEMRVRLRNELERKRDRLAGGARRDTDFPLPSAARGSEGEGWKQPEQFDLFATAPSRPPLTPAHSNEGHSARRFAGIEEQLALLDTAHISTLHSFCLELVRDHFHELEIDPQVTVLDEAQSVPLIQQTLDALLDRCYSGTAPWADAIRNLIRQRGGSDDKVRALVLKLHRYTQSLPPSERWLERELARLESPQPPNWREWLLRGVIEWRDEWMPEAERFADSPHVARCLAAIRRLDGRSSFADIAEAMRCVAEAEKEKWPSPHSKSDYRDPIRGFFEDAKFLLSLAERPRGSDPLAEDWNWLREPTRALLQLTQEFTAEFTRAKRAQGGVDFADLEQLALRLLVDQAGEPTTAARSCRRRFDYVFVDECQDINAAQDAIIRAVSREGNAECGTRNAEQPGTDAARSGNRFLVGDVKQSIYRFRRAAPRIFRHYEEQWRHGKGGQRIPLADNFRSREAILNFINPLFAALMRPGIGGVHYDEDAQLRFGAPDERGALSAASGATRVELHVVHEPAAGGSVTNGDETGSSSDDGSDGDSRGGPVEDVLAIEKEARLVARLLRDLKDNGREVWDEDRKAMRRVEWRDMAVLLRSPSPRVETFAKEFSAAGIPLAAARAGFYSAIEVQDIVNLLRLLDNPLQDIPLAAVLRSPLVALSAEELATVRIVGANGDRHATFFSAVNGFYYHAASGTSPEATSARAKLKLFFESFSGWRRLARQTSVLHCLEKVLAETHYESLLLVQPRGRERVANVQCLLELIRRYDPFQRQGLYRFLHFIDEQQDAELDEQAALVEGADAVRLMSIHRSKGLEFPVVVLACLAAQFNRQDLNEQVLLNEEFGLCPKIVPPHGGPSYPSLPWWLAKRRETRELLGEEMRLLYVAMTRARDTLLLTAFDKSKRARPRWHDGPSELSDHAVLKSQSYFDWVRRWLGAGTTDANWFNECEGATEWLRWTLHPHLDTNRVALPVSARQTSSLPPAFDLEKLRERLAWQYPFATATKEPAKTNVSVLRRRATEQDDEAHRPFAQRRRVRGHTALTAVEIGSAHHSFMQRVDFERTRSTLELRNQAEQLVDEGFLTIDEAAALDYDALLAFWMSEFGRRVASASRLVHRELPFTARFSIGELHALGFDGPGAEADEFVVVQGIVDLALIADGWIEILDFKTDRTVPGEERQVAARYEPQIQLYAAALRTIYRRPVRSAALHFLASGKTLPISVR